MTQRADRWHRCQAPRDPPAPPCSSIFCQGLTSETHIVSFHNNRGSISIKVKVCPNSELIWIHFDGVPWQMSNKVTVVFFPMYVFFLPRSTRSGRTFLRNSISYRISGPINIIGRIYLYMYTRYGLAANYLH